MIRAQFETDGFRVDVQLKGDGRWWALLERRAARGWVGVGEVRGSGVEVREFVLGEDRFPEAVWACRWAAGFLSDDLLASLAP